MTYSAGSVGSAVTCLLFADGGGGLPGLPFTGMTCLPFLAARARFSLLVHCVAIVARFFLLAVVCVEEKECAQTRSLLSHATAAAGRAATRVL